MPSINSSNLIKCQLDKTLDDFNWFYFFQPFDNTVFSMCINSIIGSIGRKKRKVKIKTVVVHKGKE